MQLQIRLFCFFFICFYLLHRQVRPVTLCESFFICVEISWDGSYGNHKRAADTKNLGERHWMFVSTLPRVRQSAQVWLSDVCWLWLGFDEFELFHFHRFEFGGSKPKTVQFVHFSSHRRSFSRKEDCMVDATYGLWSQSIYTNVQFSGQKSEVVKFSLFRIRCMDVVCFNGSSFNCTSGVAPSWHLYRYTVHRYTVFAWIIDSRIDKFGARVMRDGEFRVTFTAGRWITHILSVLPSFSVKCWYAA